jgi:hypothetical protein
MTQDGAVLTNSNGGRRRGIWIVLVLLVGILWLILDMKNSQDEEDSALIRAKQTKAHNTSTTTSSDTAGLDSNHQNPEIITAPKPTYADGFIQDPEMLCEELLKRANGTQEGNEPWRSNHPLIWKSNDCGNQGISVLGNHLSRWYMMRAIAAAAGVTIEETCVSPVTDLISQRMKPLDTSLDGDTHFSWKEACHSGGLTHPHGGFENGNGLDRVASVIRSDLRALVQTVLSTSEPDLDEVTIHLRTGDIARQRGALYGMVPFRVYTKLLPSTAKTIGIVTAPFKQERPDWGYGDADLNEAIVTAARDYIQRAFPDAKVSIRNSNETMAMTYVRMVAANWSFCGPSTFCLYPAIATMGESYILQSPLFGDSPTWLNKLDESFQNVHYIDETYMKNEEFWEWNVSDIVKMLESNDEK